MDQKLKRRWFRFSVRTLFVLVTLIALGLGWFTYQEYVYRQQFVTAEGERVLPYLPGVRLDQIVRFSRIAKAVITVRRRVEDEAGERDEEQEFLTQSVDATTGGTLALRFRISKGRLEVIRTDCESAQLVLDLAPQYSPPAINVYTSAEIPGGRILRDRESEIVRLQFWTVVDPSGRRVCETYLVNLRPE